MIELIVIGNQLTESQVLERLQHIEEEKESLILYVLKELKAEYEELKQPRNIPVDITITYNGNLPTMVDRGTAVLSYKEQDELKKQLLNKVDKSLFDLYDNVEMKEYTKQFKEFQKKVDNYRAIFKDNRFMLKSL